MCGSLQQGNGFYSSYFIVPKKDVGLCCILDLRVLNDSVMQLKFKMLTLRQIVPEIRSEDWFFTIDLKDAHFHISILPCNRKFLRFAFGGKAYQYQVSINTPHFYEMHRCNSGASASSRYSHIELHRRLVDSSSFAFVGSSASRYRSYPHERIGVMAKCQEE